jgi:KTSC domain
MELSDLTPNIPVPIESSFILAASYDPVALTLTIEFKDGSPSRDYTVSPATALAFFAASSPGAYFNANIRE